MSELKAETIVPQCTTITLQMYPKSEVDKVMKEKDEKIAELEMKVARAQLVLRLNKPEALFSDLEIMGRLRHKIDVVERRERHQKYKRCLAMAKLCNEKWLVHNFAEIPTKLGFYDRWEKRWLELAEKFKPNNSTSQYGKGNKMKATKKKVTIECLKWNRDNFSDIEAFCGKGVARIAPCMQTGDNELYIKTLEGAHMACVGDFIIKGVKGEFYPCKPDIFAQTYDIVDGDSRVREFVETRHDLLTTKYTKVLEESEYQYNAPHTFQVIRTQEENSEEHKGENLVLSEIHFQEGPIKECGVNGVMNEDLLVMVIRRLEGFQNSEFKCRENACAITKLEEALLWLRKRTMGRENRGVEGTHTV